MEEFVKYIASLEQRIAALETRCAELEAREPEVIEKIVEVPVEKIVEKIVEVPVEKAPDEEPEVEVEFIFDESPIEEDGSETSDTSTPSTPDSPIHRFSDSPKQGVQAPAVDDIRKAISLGDRFLFTRELFDNQGEKMQMVLDEINAKSNLEEALAYLDKHFSWDKESKTYQLFEVALKRRFC